MIAGGIAAALTTPLDVVKTRAMLEAKVCLAAPRSTLTSPGTDFIQFYVIGHKGRWGFQASRIGLVDPDPAGADNIARGCQGSLRRCGSENDVDISRRRGVFGCLRLGVGSFPAPDVVVEVLS